MKNVLPQIAQIMGLAETEVINHPDFLVNAFDHEHRVLFWNKKCEQYFGISKKNAIGEIVEDLVPHSNDNPKMRLLDSALSGKTVFVADNKYDKKNAHYTQMVIPLKNEEGQVVAALNIVSDIPQPVSSIDVYKTFSKT